MPEISVGRARRAEENAAQLIARVVAASQCAALSVSPECAQKLDDFSDACIEWPSLSHAAATDKDVRGQPQVTIDIGYK